MESDSMGEKKENNMEYKIDIFCHKNIVDYCKKFVCWFR